PQDNPALKTPASCARNSGASGPVCSHEPPASSARQPPAAILLCRLPHSRSLRPSKESIAKCKSDERVQIIGRSGGPDVHTAVESQIARHLIRQPGIECANPIRASFGAHAAEILGVD